MVLIARRLGFKLYRSGFLSDVLTYAILTLSLLIVTFNLGFRTPTFGGLNMFGNALPVEVIATFACLFPLYSFTDTILSGLLGPILSYELVTDDQLL